MRLRSLLLPLLLLILCPMLAEGQIRMISGPTAEAFFPLNDVRYVNVSGDTMTGALTLSAGSVSAPAVTFGSHGDGFYQAANDAVLMSVGGTLRHQWGANEIRIYHDSGQVRFGLTTDTNIKREAAGIVSITGASSGGALNLQPMAAPASPASGGVIYIDSADSDLKIKYSDGTVVVIGNKP